MESMASAIINKMVHGTMVTLKAEATSAGGAAYVDAARRFFNLEETPAGCTTGHAEGSDRAGGERSKQWVRPAPDTSLIPHTTKEAGRRVS